jgi:hypothetical protein
MGQAKNRGTFEQRQSEAYDRIDKATVELADNMKKLDESLKQSEKIMLESSTSLITSFLAVQEKQRKSRMGIRIGGHDGHAS